MMKALYAHFSRPAIIATALSKAEDQAESPQGEREKAMLETKDTAAVSQYVDAMDFDSRPNMPDIIVEPEIINPSSSLNVEATSDTTMTVEQPSSSTTETDGNPTQMRSKLRTYIVNLDPAVSQTFQVVHLLRISGQISSVSC